MTKLKDSQNIIPTQTLNTKSKNSQNTKSIVTKIEKQESYRKYSISLVIVYYLTNDNFSINKLHTRQWWK